MTIFKEYINEEYLTIAEAKELLETIEQERALDDDRDFPYELARTLDHVNQFAVLDPDESRELVDRLLELETLDEPTAYKIANLLPRDRDELRTIFSESPYSLDGDELDKILGLIAEYIDIDIA